MDEQDQILRDRLLPWLGRRWSGARALRLGDFESPKSGFSARTVVVPVAFEREGRACEERVVLRLENPEPAIYPQQAPGLECEVEIQYRAMEAIGRAMAASGRSSPAGRVPLAPLVGYEPDPGVIGTPFYVMEYVEGQVPVEDPIYTKQGFFVDASPAERRRLVERGLDTLAGVHAIDWRAAGLEWLVPPRALPDARRQLDLWDQYAQRELAGREHPSLARALAWLRAHAPEGLVPALSWGDARPGNIIWRDFEPVCVTDFENVAIAPPEVDLGWWLMFDRWSHEAFGGERLEGEPTRDEQRAYYAARVGRDVGDTYWFELLGAARYAAIVVRVMNRMVERDMLPADQMIWLQNPAATCLDQLLDERGI